MPGDLRENGTEMEINLRAEQLKDRNGARHLIQNSSTLERRDPESSVSAASFLELSPWHVLTALSRRKKTKSRDEGFISLLWSQVDKKGKPCANRIGEQLC